MGFRHVVITQPAQLSTLNNQLCIQVRDQEKVTVPIEDISSLTIETWNCQLTPSVLHSVSQYAPVIVCGKNHIPESVITPLNTNSTPLSRLQLQIDMSVPLKKQLWQKIVAQKITNQGAVISTNQTVHKTLLLYANQVKSGDNSCREGIAAKTYFPAMFGNSFRRRSDSVINSALNYGYAVIRASIARSLSARGFALPLGIFHRGPCNSCNLADDFIEPYRPIVDSTIKSLVFKENYLTPDDKKNVLSILIMPVMINERKYELNDSIPVMIDSYIRVLEEKNLSELRLPSTFIESK